MDAKELEKILKRMAGQLLNKKALIDSTSIQQSQER